jgi:hypothetical protein
MHQNNNQTKLFAARIIFDAILFFAVLFLPWWCFVVLIFIGGMIFRSYFEAFAFGLFMDALYGTEVFVFYGFSLFFSFTGICTTFMTEFLKKKIRLFATL